MVLDWEAIFLGSPREAIALNEEENALGVGWVLRREKREEALDATAIRETNKIIF